MKKKNEALAETLARAIFALGDEPGSPCHRIQFKGGAWPDNERDQGGLGETSLAAFIAAQLEASETHSDPVFSKYKSFWDEFEKRGIGHQK